MGIEDDILRLLDGHHGQAMPAAGIAAQLGKEVTLIEGYLDRLESKGEVELARKYGGCDAVITPLGVARVHEPSASHGGLAAGEVRARLQEQLDEVEKLIDRRSAATLEEMKDWVDWTFTVIKRAFGDKSGKLSEFKGVMMGGWPFDGEPAQAQGYRQRLPEWRRLLRMWIREIDEFEAPGDLTEQYIRPRSQFDAYVQLRHRVEEASASVVVVDPYVDDSTLQPLLAVKPAVSLRLLTVKPSKDFAHAVERFREQWGGNIEARKGTKELHDRFLLVDDKVFFSGASFKDLGQRGSMIDEIRTEAIKQTVKNDIEEWWAAAQPIA